jgi:hypothetical protein
VLKVYSNWDTSFGYCQGMNFIVGMLLMYMEQEVIFDEFFSWMKSAFWMLVVIMQNHKMVGLFQVHVEKLCLHLKKGPLLPYFINHFDKEFKQFLPNLHSHFVRYICLFLIF